MKNSQNSNAVKLRSSSEIEGQLSSTLTKIENLKVLLTDLKSKSQYTIAKGVEAQLKPFYIKRDCLQWFLSGDNGTYDAISLEMVNHAIDSVKSMISQLEDMKELQVQETNWAVVSAIKLQLSTLYIKQKWLLWLIVSD